MNARRAAIAARAPGMWIPLLVLLGPPAMTDSTQAQDSAAIPINQDESRVAAYTLPDPLRFEDGRKVDGPAAWPARRAELLELFARDEYGRTPQTKVPMAIQTVERSASALDGKATRVQLELVYGTAPRTVTCGLLLYLPNHIEEPVPAIVGYNFNGNHAVRPDPEIRISPGWFRDEPKGSHPSNRADEKTRGAEATRWDIAHAIDRGYAVATMYYGDIDPDFDDGFKNGIPGLVDPAGTSDPNRPADAWGSIGAWAWGLSRALDALAAQPEIDAARVAVFGHSRLGKAALWAGVQDQRFALVISNQSGCGGAALSKRDFGETVKRINTSFPHWFCDNFARFNGNEAALPIDQHELLALVAPRPLLVCSAAEDLWADPRGEFLSCVGADPVYRLLGKDGLAATEMPAVNEKHWGRLMYHVRPGKHDVTPADWALYIDFMDRYLK